MDTARRLLAVAGVALFCVVAQGQSNAAPVPLNIPEQRMQDALNALAEQAGLQVVFAVASVEGKTSPKVEGSYTPEAALRILLSGTSLSYEFIGEKIIAIRGASATGAPASAESATIAWMRAGGVPAANEAETETGKKSFWQRFRLAQNETSQPSTAATETGASPGRENTPLEELVVTGTRIQRQSGYDQPTPVTALSAEALQRGAPSTIADGLNQLPQFASSQSRTGCCTPGSIGTYLNLRGLASTPAPGSRTLILLDGDRLTPTREVGDVDVNLLPELLVQRVDVVTGGASAVYGSDAVAGVVNYVIDRKFTGLKVTAQTGLSSYGDDRDIKLGVAGGLSFADDRAHFLAGIEHYKSDGIDSLGDRNFASRAHFLGGNGSAAAPYADLTNVRGASGTGGGVIVNAANQPIANAGAPLAGLLFEPAGATRQFQFGTPVAGSPNFYQGGDGFFYGFIQPLADLRTDKLYSRVSYDLTDTLEAFLRVNAAESHSTQFNFENNQRGANAVTIFRENAFLPASVAALMDTAGATSFRMGRQSHDFGLLYNDYKNRTYDVSAGLQGALGSRWTWRANYAHGRTRMEGAVSNNAILDNLYAAVDAVTDPSTGQTVCRVTLTNPGVFPGCVPVNLFGEGSPSSAALDFVTGTSTQNIENTQDIVAASMQGQLFDVPAGTVSAALGLEYRERSLLEESNAIALGQAQSTGVRGMPGTVCPTPTTCRFGRFNQANFGTADASDDVKEAFVETLVPLLGQLPGVHSLELNGAYRYTDYKNSGSVGTWKAGLQYSPIEGLRLRGTRSRDIRAPNLYELFAGPVTSFQAGIVDPLTGVNLASVVTRQQGNPNLEPEKADTKTIGIVYQPAWLPGFSGSVDYYDIDIGGALRLTQVQDTLNQCQAGDTVACSLITRDASGNIQQIIVQNINLTSRRTSGFDFDLSYTANAGRGVLGMRAVLTHVTDFVDTVGGVSTQYVDYNPSYGNKWRGNLNASYEIGRLSLSAQERYIGSVKRVVGTPGTPQVFVHPDIPAIFYTDLTGVWKVRDEGGLEVYGTVNNLFNKKPPFMPNNLAPGLAYPTEFNTYDIVGAYFTVGARARF